MKNFLIIALLLLCINTSYAINFDGDSPKPDAVGPGGGGGGVGYTNSKIRLGVGLIKFKEIRNSGMAGGISYILKLNGGGGVGFR